MTAIDIKKLRDFAVPSVRQELSARDIAFYARSIGMGRDALNPGQLCFVDPLRGRSIMPAMVLVMAHSGFSTPVYPGDTIRTEIWNDGSFRAMVTARGAVVIEGGRARFTLSPGAQP